MKWFLALTSCLALVHHFGMVRIILKRWLAMHLAVPAGARKVVTGDLHVGRMAISRAVKDSRVGGSQGDDEGGDGGEE